MTRYETLKHKPKRFLSLTGYTLEEFSALVPYFSKRFLASVETKTLEGKHRKKRRYTQYKNRLTKRVSTLNISRWPSEGGSYRTVQRFFNTVIP